MTNPIGVKQEQIYSVYGSELANYSSADAVPSRCGGSARALYLGVSGTVKVTYQDGTIDTLTNLAAGMWHPMSVSKIWNVGTTASLDIHFGY